MTSAPPPAPEPTAAERRATELAHAEARQTMDVQFYRGTLHALIDVGAAFVERARQQGLAEDADSQALAAAAATYEQVSRAMRRSILLAERLTKPQRTAPDGDERRAAARKRVLRAVEDAIQAEAADDEQAEQLRGEAVERLERPEFAADLEAMSVPALTAEIMHDLALAAPAGTRPWARRTPDDVAALAAWAAAPPGTAASLPPLRTWAAERPEPPQPDYAHMSDAELMRHLPPGTPRLDAPRPPRPRLGVPGAAQAFSDSG